jgi:hypothetical protein
VERIHKAVKEAMGMVLNGPASSAGSGAASSAAPSVGKTMLKELFVERHRRAHRPVGILNVLLPCPVSPSNILEELVDPPRASMLGPVRAQALTQGRNWHIHVLKVD